MNGAERLMTALKRQIPDRVPHMELAYNESSIIGIAKHFTDNVPPLNYVQRMGVEDKIKLFEALRLETNPMAAKEALALMGMPGGGFRPPLTPLSEPNKEKVKTLLRDRGLI